MALSMRSKSSKFLVYAIVGALIVGMAGFGISDVLSGNSRSDIATVGKTKVTQQDFSRALVQAVNATSQQFGQQLTMEQARLFGLDSSTLNRLITSRALENEAANLGIAATDDMLRASIISTPAFLNSGGQFDAEAYNYALRNSNYSVREYEALIRAELSRNLMQSSIITGIEVNTTGAATLGRFLNEEFTIDWARIALDAVPMPDAPTEAELSAWHAANAADYTLPETRKLTVVALSLADMVAGAGITDEQVAAEYEANLANYQTPERRGVDRIVFPDDAAAADARARLDAGEVTFEDLVVERGITEQLASLGLVAAESLKAEARSGVFELTEPGIVGPLPSDLGPALYRVNAIIAATTTPLVDVANDIRAALAEPFVRQQSAEVYSNAEELIAAGASLEDVAAETGMVLSTMDFSSGSSEGLAANAKFRDEAAAAELGQERDLIEADDRSLFALRVDEITPPTVQPLEDVREAVTAAWTADAHFAALQARADSLVTQITAGAGFLAVMDALSLGVVNTPGLKRGAPSDAVPQPVAAAAFDLAEGGVAAVADGDAYIVLHVSSITEADPTSYADYVARRQDADTLGLSDDIYEYYASAIRNTAGVNVNTPLVEAVVNSIR